MPVGSLRFFTQAFYACLFPALGKAEGAPRYSTALLSAAQAPTMAGNETERFRRRSG